jgi:hypothetical protein
MTCTTGRGVSEQRRMQNRQAQRRWRKYPSVVNDMLDVLRMQAGAKQRRFRGEDIFHDESSCGEADTSIHPSQLDALDEAYPDSVLGCTKTSEGAEAGTQSCTHHLEDSLRLEDDKRSNPSCLEEFNWAFADPCLDMTLLETSIADDVMTMHSSERLPRDTPTTISVVSQDTESNLCSIRVLIV